MHADNGSRGKRSASNFRHAMDAGLGVVLLKLVVGLVIVLSLTGGLKTLLRPVQPFLDSRAAAPKHRGAAQPEATGAQALQARPKTAETARQSAVDADKTARILDRSSPEM